MSVFENKWMCICGTKCNVSVHCCGCACCRDECRYLCMCLSHGMYVREGERFGLGLVQIGLIIKRVIREGTYESA